jgi:CxxC motif-containing protein
MAEYNEEEIKEIYGAQCKKGVEFVENEIKTLCVFLPVLFDVKMETTSGECKNQ